jgi:hypothetical protein
MGSAGGVGRPPPVLSASLLVPPPPNLNPHPQESAPFLRVLGSYPMDLELGVVDSDKPFDGSGQA